METALEKILVLSDLHGMTSYAINVLRTHPDYGTVCFLGDGTRQIGQLQKDWPRVWHIVRGNCDLFSDGHYPDEAIFETENHRIFLTHGHRYFVKHDEEMLLTAAAARGADIVLYGHTHICASHYNAEHGVYLFNPGSIGAPRDARFTYGLLTISGSDILFSIGEQKPGLG